MSGGDESRTRRALAWQLLACTTLALANLPSDELPPGWLLAFVLPGALLARLLPRLHRPWQRALAGVALQLGACWLVLATVGPIARPAALACTILPPLGFATARQQDGDQPLALFLGFCVLLVGVILDGVHLPLLVAWGSVACLALGSSSRLAVLAVAQPAAVDRPPAARGGLAATATTVAGCVFAALALERTLAWLPSPSDRAPGSAQATTTGGRRVGLDDSFVLDGRRGVLAELTGEQLVRVRDPAGSPVPADLYLRSGFFTVPGLDRWELGPLDLVPASRPDGHALRPPLPGVPLRELEIERFAGARDFVFVPPGACEVEDLQALFVDPAREWIRQRTERPARHYLVVHQPPPPLPPDPALDPRARRHGLLTLPRDLDRGRCEALLAAWQVGAEPLAAFARIADGLARHCRYDRIEPIGPFAHALENFLFADGDRRGYCMHFASATALLLRLRGIPCRIGVGLFGGDADRREAGARVFGSQHAHAWVEIPVAGRGYVVLDPTPPAERGQRTPTRPDPGEAADAAPATPPAAAAPLAALADLVLQPWVLALALLTALLVAVWPRPALAAAAPAAPAPARSARRLLARLLQALAAAGHARARGQTLEELAGALARRRRLAPELAAAFAAYQQVRFGGRPFDDERERLLQQGLAAALRLRETDDAGST